MIVWIDAQLPPHLAAWITEHFGIQSESLYDIGMREAEDEEIFQAAREIQAVIMTKDEDFRRLLARHGIPPQILWVRTGNIHNRQLKSLLQAVLPGAFELVRNGTSLVEIRPSA